MTAMDEAKRRLSTALTRLEEQLDVVSDQIGQAQLARKEIDNLIKDRADLADQLDAALYRENELQKLADEASHMLGSAIAEVHAALESQGV